RSALREDPEVLRVGEMRNLESIDVVLTMAETGHLVFATLHTNDTAQTVDRLVGVFPGERQDQVRMQLSTCLSGVIYQRLIPRMGGGLVAAFEVLVGTHAVRNLIREGHLRPWGRRLASPAAPALRRAPSVRCWCTTSVAPPCQGAADPDATPIRSPGQPASSERAADCRPPARPAGRPPRWDNQTPV